MDSQLGNSMLQLSISYGNMPIGSSHWVYVTHIKDPNDFYVRPAAYKSHLKSLRLNLGPADPSELELGTIVVFKSDIKTKHVRGCIRNIRNENGKTVYDIFTLDYGFFEPSVTIDNVKKAHNNCQLPATVIHCTLADCVPKGDVNFDEKAIEAMVYYIGDGQVRMVIRGKVESNKYLVELHESSPDISTLMALTGYTCLGYANNVISRMPTVPQPKLYYTYKQLKVGDTIKVRIQSGDSLKSFYVCEPEDHKYYNKEYKKTQFFRYEQDFRAEDLLVGKPVGVFSDWHRSYERAIITDVIKPEESAIVQLVDWGTKLDIHMSFSRLKILSREYYFLKPAMAIFCMAEEGQVFDNALHRILHAGYEILITIKQVGKEFKTPNVVSISDVSKQ